jgi:AcrR family transcriptional regulator
MGRPIDIEKRRELGQRAVEVLREEGLDISNARLAEALEIKRPTLLYHFPSRAHLVEQALEELLTEQMVFVMERVNQHSHPIDRINAQIRAVHEFHRDREDRIVFLSQAIATSSRARMDEIIDVGNRVFAAQRAAATELLRDGIEKGIVAPCDPEALIATIRAAQDGLMVQRVMTGVDLAPVHDFIWKHVLEPLKIERHESTEEREDT